MRRRCQKVEHDLETDVGKIGQGFLKRLTAHGEKAAHGIADLRADHLLAEPRRRARQRFPLLIPVAGRSLTRIARADDKIGRSEEHTSELQSLMRISYAVFCLKKKNKSIEKKSTATMKKQTTNTTPNVQNNKKQ